MFHKAQNEIQQLLYKNSDSHTIDQDMPPLEWSDTHV